MAGVDQGSALVGSDLDLLRAYDPARGFEGGIGYPGGPAITGSFRVRKGPLGELSASGPTNVDRPAIVKPAGTDQGAVNDPLTDGQLVTATALWFEDVHILPRTKVEFGNILTQKTEDYEIFSAYRRDDQTLSTITNNAEPGTDLPDESTPETVRPLQSMLDATTTDNCGNTIALGTVVKRSLIAESDGLSTFDTSIVFTFSSGELVTVLLSGSRIVLIPFEFETDPVEIMQFLTDVQPSISGKEQRVAELKDPRQAFEVTYALDGNDRQRMDALLMDWLGNIFGFPLWHEVKKTTAAVTAGATVYTVNTTADVDFRTGGLAVIFTDANTFDVITIQSMTATTITASDPSVNGYAEGTEIMPLRTAYVTEAVPGRRFRRGLETFNVSFRVTDNHTGSLTGDTSAFSSYNGRVLLDDCNVTPAQTSGERFFRRLFVIDNGTGVISVQTPWDRYKRDHTKGFVARSREEILNLKKLLIALRGQQIAFYIPTFFEDVTVKAALVSGASTMDIENIEYERFVRTRDPKTIMRVEFTDGTNLERVVQSVANVDSTTERLTLDTTWPAARTTDEISRVMFYELVRFNTDSFRLEFAHIGQASLTAPVRAVFDDV